MYEDGNNAYVLGCRNSDRLESKPCSVSILPSQSLCRSSHTFTIHFTFELLLPFPSVFVALDYSFPGCLLLNTGISLLCVTYVLSKENTHDVAHYSISSTRTAAQSVIKVFEEDEPMVLLHEKAHSSRLSVRHTTLDVDSWISIILPQTLHEDQYKYHFLCDYNLKVIEMDPRCNITFIVVAVVQVSSTVKFMKCAVTLVGQWHMNSGSCKLLYSSCLEPTTAKADKWLETLSTIRKKYELTTLPFAMIKSLSNMTVFSGRSLEEINHPHLPITLVL